MALSRRDERLHAEVLHGDPQAKFALLVRLDAMIEVAIGTCTCAYGTGRCMAAWY